MLVSSGNAAEGLEVGYGFDAGATELCSGNKTFHFSQTVCRRTTGAKSKSEEW